MPLEIGSFINDLTPSNPLGSDPAGQGDDHLRLIKTTVQGTFPQMGAVFGRVRTQDTAVSISSIWNTNHFVCSASATATVVLTLPPAASITSGFYVDITTIGTGTVSLLPSGAASINGGVSLSIPRLNTARAYFVGGTSWLADVVPHGQGSSVFANLTVDGTLSVSGATVLGVLAVGSTLSVSGATVLTGPLTVNNQATLNALTVVGTTTLSGTVVLGNGQLVFPAVQNPSAGANTLDDYEEGTWTPTVTFATPGDLNVVYSVRVGQYVKIGRQIYVTYRVDTTTFTHTTASGIIIVTGLPFSVPAGAVNGAVGPLIGGRCVLTVNYTYTATRAAEGTAQLELWQCSNNGSSAAQMAVANFPTATNHFVWGSASYFAAN